MPNPLTTMAAVQKMATSLYTPLGMGMGGGSKHVDRMSTCGGLSMGEKKGRKSFGLPVEGTGKRRWRREERAWKGRPQRFPTRARRKGK
jgi:hypothetical protein